jgi:hypothetical protein
MGQNWAQGWALVNMGMKLNVTQNARNCFDYLSNYLLPPEKKKFFPRVLCKQINGLIRIRIHRKKTLAEQSNYEEKQWKNFFYLYNFTAKHFNLC